MKFSEHIIQTYLEDTDITGLVYHPNYLKYLERARSQLLIDVGIDQNALIQNEKRGFVVAKVSINYKRPIFFAEKIVVQTRILKLEGVRMEVEQNIFGMTKAPSDLRCEGQILLCSINIDTKKPAPLPSLVLEKCALWLPQDSPR